MKILPKKFYNRPTLRVAQDLLGCFLVRRLKNTPFNKGGVGGFKTPFKSGVGRFLKYKIVETEAYNGPNDLASHASIGRTERNSIMFGEPGTIYVYFTYGMHYMLNIVTERKDYPAAALIRAVELVCHCEEPAASRSFSANRRIRTGCAISARRIKHLNKNIHGQLAHRDCFPRPAEAGCGVAMTNKTNGPAKLTKALKIDKLFNGLPVYRKLHGLWIESRAEKLKPSQIVRATRVGIDYARGYKDKKWRFYIKDNEFVSKK